MTPLTPEEVPLVNPLLVSACAGFVLIAAARSIYLLARRSFQKKHPPIPAVRREKITDGR